MYISDEEKQKFPFNSSMDTETLNFSELSSDTEGKSHCSYYSSSDSEFGDIDGTGSEDELVFTSQHLEITKKFAVTNKRKRNLPNSKPKRLRVYCNPLSKPLKEFTPVTCIGEIEFTGSNINEIFETARELPEFFAPVKIGINALFSNLICLNHLLAGFQELTCMYMQLRPTQKTQ